MALTPFDFTRDIFSPAEEFFGGGLLRPFEPMLRSRESGLPIAMPRAMALDVKELDNAFDVKADIPGVSKNDIQINVDNNVLTIRVSLSTGFAHSACYGTATRCQCVIRHHL